MVGPWIRCSDLQKGIYSAVVGDLVQLKKRQTLWWRLRSDSGGEEVEASLFQADHNHLLSGPFPLYLHTVTYYACYVSSIQHKPMVVWISPSASVLRRIYDLGELHMSYMQISTSILHFPPIQNAPHQIHPFLFRKFLLRHRTGSRF